MIIKTVIVNFSKPFCDMFIKLSLNEQTTLERDATFSVIYKQSK